MTLAALQRRWSDRLINCSRFIVVLFLLYNIYPLGYLSCAMSQNMVLSLSFMTKTKTSKCGQMYLLGHFKTRIKSAFKVDVIELGRKRFCAWRLKLPWNLTYVMWISRFPSLHCMWFPVPGRMTTLSTSTFKQACYNRTETDGEHFALSSYLIVKSKHIPYLIGTSENYVFQWTEIKTIEKTSELLFAHYLTTLCSEWI